MQFAAVQSARLMQFAPGAEIFARRSLFWLLRELRVSDLGDLGIVGKLARRPLITTWSQILIQIRLLPEFC